MIKEQNLHLRRYSQSHVVSFSSAKDALTVPYTRGRSYSASAAHGSLAAQLIASVNEKLKVKETDYDCSFIDYMDDQIHETWDTAKALLLGSKRLLLLEELPKDRRENEYVLSGYRFYRSTKDCLRSLFRLHNETMNIWSHLLGFVFFSCLSVNIFQVRKKEVIFLFAHTLNHLPVFLIYLEKIPRGINARSFNLYCILFGFINMSFMLIYLPHVYLSFSTPRQEFHSYFRLHWHYVFNYSVHLAGQPLWILLRPDSSLALHHL